MLYPPNQASNNPDFVIMKEVALQDQEHKEVTSSKLEHHSDTHNPLCYRVLPPAGQKAHLQLHEELLEALPRACNVALDSSHTAIC